MCPGITGEGMAGRCQMVMESPGAGQAEYTRLLVTPGLASAPTQEKKRNPQGPTTQTWALGKCWMMVAKQGGRRMTAHHLLLSLAAPAHMSLVSTGYLLPALLLQVTHTDTWPCYRETKPCPRAYAKASTSPSSHLQSCSFARLFCPGTEATKQRGNPRALSGPHRNTSPLNLRAYVLGL